jgi:hypothetical protein
MPPLDGCDVMELFLNLLWLAIAAAALHTAPQQSKRVSFALGCALAMLFPIVSVSDDLLPDREAFEEALALVVNAVILLVALVALARVAPLRLCFAKLHLIPLTDPRSPPRGF